MIKRKKLKNLFEGIINSDKKYFYYFSIYLSVQVCLSLLVPDFFDVLCSVFRHCQCFHKAFFSFCHEICILNNCLKVVFECVFFSFCHEICILDKRLKVIFEWVFFYTGNIATSHFFWLFSICL